MKSDENLIPVELLAEHPVFNELDPTSLEKLAAYLERRTYAPGETVISSDEPAEGLMFIEKGSVACVRRIEEEQTSVELGSRKAGQILGESALLPGWESYLQASAEQETSVWIIRQNRLPTIIPQFPGFVRCVIRDLCSLVRKGDLELLGELKESERRMKDTLAELQRVGQRLLETEKEAAIGEMVAGIIRRLNTPLRELAGLTQKLLEMELADELAVKLWDLFLQTERIQKFLDDLERTSRIGRGEPALVEVDLNRECESIATTFRFDRAARGFRITTRLRRQVPKIETDEGRFRLLLLFLLRIAASLSEEDAELTIRTSTRELTADELSSCTPLESRGREWLSKRKLVRSAEHGRWVRVDVVFSVRPDVEPEDSFGERVELRELDLIHRSDNGRVVASLCVELGGMFLVRRLGGSSRGFSILLPIHK